MKNVCFVFTLNICSSQDRVRRTQDRGHACVFFRFQAVRTARAGFVFLNGPGHSRNFPDENFAH